MDTADALSLRRLFTRPGLLLRELGWRWGCGGLLLLLLAYAGRGIYRAVQPALAATGIVRLLAESRGNLLVMDPEQMLGSFPAAAAVLAPPLERAILGLLPLAVFCWAAAFAIGRTAVLVRFDARLPRRPFLLAVCQGFELLLGVSLFRLWSVLVKAACGPLWSSRPIEMLLLLTAFSAAVFWAWRFLTFKVQLAMALGLVENIGGTEALRRAFHLPDKRILGRSRRFEKRMRRLQILVLLPILVLPLLPSPFAGTFFTAAWRVVLSLLPLAATDAVRLAVFFGLLEDMREELALRAAALPGTLPRALRL